MFNYLIKRGIVINMNVLLAGTISETQKIISRKKNVALLIIMLSIVFISAIVNLVASNTLGADIINHSKLPVTVLDFAIALIIPIFIFMITSDLFAGEISNNSMILSLVRPISRTKVYLSKLLSVGIFIIGILAITFLDAFIVSLFGDSISEVFGKLLLNLNAYVAAVVPLIMLVVITAFVAQFLKSSSGTIVLMIIGLLILPVLGTLLPEVRSILPTTYLDWYQNFSYGSVDIVSVANEFMFILAYVIIFLSLGIFFFEKKDI
jgi:ABC-2 type transport system permease protein